MRVYSNHIPMSLDPEFLLLDEKGNAFPSTLVFPKKEEALRLGRNDYPENGGSTCESSVKVFTDGRQAEWTIAPQTCREWLLDECWLALYHARNTVKAFNAKRKNKIKMVLGSCAPMSLTRIKRGGALCCVSGCNPDFNAYSYGEPNPPTRQYDSIPLAMAGCHIHYNIFQSWKDGSPDVFNKMYDVKLNDRITGLIMMLIMRGEKENIQRRKYYGRAGCFRTPIYGREYRTLGSDILNSPGTLSLALGLARFSAEVCGMGQSSVNTFMNVATDDEIRQAIDSCDRDLGLKIWARLSDICRTLDVAYLENYSPFSTHHTLRDHDYKDLCITPFAALDYFIKGHAEFGKDWEQNWRLDGTPDHRVPAGPAGKIIPFYGHGHSCKGYVFMSDIILKGNHDYKRYETLWRERKV